MISQAIRFFKAYRPLYSLRMAFTTDSHKLNGILAKIQVQSEGKEVGLLESGVVASQHMDPASKKMTITLNLNKDYRQIKSLIRAHLEAEGVTDVDIALAAKPKEEKYQRKGNLLGIKRIIAVSSCKGGVGKSTIAVNLAASLSRQGKLVGIFDSDIYGPSLPTLIGKEGTTLEARQQNPKEIVPVEYEGIKCMSFGFVATKPAVMRGPMVSSVLSQLLHQTHWGELDYLVVDMPPGTGDIQISLCQQLKFDGAVIVTTPQRLAFMDVIKGIQMFQDLRVKILSVVENMAYHYCQKCGYEDLVFGRGYTQMIMDQFGILNTVRFPILPEISRLSDNGTPIALVLPESHALCKTYQELCTKIQIDLEQPLERTFVYYNTATRRIIIEEKEKKKQVDPYVLRGLCRCAGCVDELSGALLIKRETIDVEVYPVRVEEKGNYAVAMVWSDGHRSSIYPYKRLLSSDIPESQL